MNSHIELCKKTIKLCRDSIANADFHAEINQLLVKYARKALEFKVGYSHAKVGANESDDTANKMVVKSRSPLHSSGALVTSKSNPINAPRKTSVSINISSPSTSIASSASSLSVGGSSNNKLSASSFKQFYKFSSSLSSNNLNLTNSNSNPSQQQATSSSLNAMFGSSNGIGSGSGSGGGGGSIFVMPATAPTKEEWVKDDDVHECMVCNTRRFTLLNRRHHCRRCGRVVCSNCSSRVTLIDSIPRRTCDDCFRAIEVQKANEKYNSTPVTTGEKSNDLIMGNASSSGKNYLGKLKKKKICCHGVEFLVKGPTLINRY